MTPEFTSLELLVLGGLLIGIPAGFALVAKAILRKIPGFKHLINPIFNPMADGLMWCARDLFGRAKRLWDRPVVIPLDKVITKGGGAFIGLGGAALWLMAKSCNVKSQLYPKKKKKSSSDDEE